MDPVLLVIAAGLGLPLLGAAVLVQYKRRADRRRLRIWKKAAQECGLADIVESHPGVHPVVLEARLDDLRVTIDRYEHPNHSGTRIVIKAASASTGVPEVERFFGAGPTAFPLETLGTATVARLDREMRERLLEVKALCIVEVEPASWCAMVPVWIGTHTTRWALARVLKVMLELTRRWPRGQEIPARLAENSLRDPDAAVRLQNLLRLAHFDAHPVTRETLLAACKDPSPEIRLHAAMALGRAEGREVLFALAESADDEIAARAIRWLGRWLPADRVTGILDRSLQAWHNATARSCIDLLGRLATEATIARVDRILTTGNPEMQVAAAQSLGWSGHPRAEAALIGALEHALPDVRMAAAGALGQVGTVTSVLPLKEAAARDGNLGAMVRQSIAAIQARVSGGAPGQLSIAGTEAGQLSLSGDAGRLTLKDEGGR
jgi:hypothetical protein